jgi:zinc transport system substrate-binding protein
MVVMSVRAGAAIALLAVGFVTAAACGPSGTTASRAATGDLRLVASFYPLQWVAQQVAGPRVEVRSLTKPGAEPHDLELAPRDVASVADADLVVYLKGFQPAVDDAVHGEAGKRGYDVTALADLDLRYTAVDDGQHVTRGGPATDPHFWLDPVRLAAVATGIASRLAAIDPARATAYRANATALAGRLHALDERFRTGLARCRSRDVVTSHNAFGYLARRYGLTQVGITGLTPEDEPRPSDLARVADFTRSHGVRTIYYETLVPRAIAKTVATETGAAVGVLDPIEGLTDASSGRDYLAVMRSNLAHLEKGQACS